MGSVNEVIYLLTETLTDEPKSISDIEKFCLSNTSHYNIPSKGIVALLEFISAITYCERGVFLNEFGHGLSKSVIDGTTSRKIVEKLLSKILLEGMYSDFLDLESISFDFIHEAYTIKNSHIPFKYSGIRNLLINYGFFKYNSNSNILLIIDKSYTDFLKEILKTVRKKLSIEKFKEMLMLKEKYGQEAEEFVLNYEKKRLSGHIHLEKLSQVSVIDVKAGYDIISFNSLSSEVYDRFIEVKSYSNNLSFYWTRNEIETSKNKGKSYYLYLVDRDKMNQIGYQPHIIANPYINVFKNNAWKREPETWFFRNDDENH
ncbi:DUF3883 domain-containing protein [Paenibacillus lutimineralis]|uniref:DUF3883 domain-containing protein n=1 Tax=Paenibacillus lutimineralis TaxID=2707005 RepID=UPI0013A65354|nr:DUF3883 domain-containing protein [Paenibacillus lutimineralis]